MVERFVHAFGVRVAIGPLELGRGWSAVVSTRVEADGHAWLTLAYVGTGSTRYPIPTLIVRVAQALILHHVTSLARALRLGRGHHFIPVPVVVE